jgi:hypothetical protein
MQVTRFAPVFSIMLLPCYLLRSINKDSQTRRQPFDATALFFSLERGQMTATLSVKGQPPHGYGGV